MPTIYVSRNGNSNKLKLRDSENHNPGDDDLTTFVNPNDYVTWVLDSPSSPGFPPGSSFSPIASIVNIKIAIPTVGPPPKYQGSVPVLIEDPNNLLDPPNWVGTVRPELADNAFENYNIWFQVPGDNTIYQDDPIIRVNPKG
jgi:hypothetical protein